MMYVLNRADGRVELMCEHGTGHPSRKLQRRTWRDVDGTHGCCGCCTLENWTMEEQRLYEERR